MINRNEAQIVARIEALLSDIALNAHEICEMLAGLDKHYLHRDPLFRWYREVASGKLIFELVQAMAKAQHLVKHMVGRPRETQMAVARDKPFDWCDIVKGEVELKRGSWRQMSAEAFKLMFPIGGSVRSLTEQRELLVQKLAAAPVTHIRRQPIARVDAEARTFKLGHQTVPLSVVLLALREAGIASTEAVQAA